jgi:CheY-like chemotaxis protein
LTSSNLIESPKVLLIEDNPGDARLVELWLEESDLFDCTIENRTTLSEGIEALSQSEYAVVLLDLTLPDSRGFQTLETLLKHYPDVNVIVLTGLADKIVGLNALLH